MSAIQLRSSGNLVVTVRLTLQPGRDDDLIAIIRSAPKGALAAIIRESMRSGVQPVHAVTEDTLDDTPLDWADLGMDV